MALSEAGAARGLLRLPRIVLFGDSITEKFTRWGWLPVGVTSVMRSQLVARLGAKFSFQDKGWGASLANRLARKCDVLNRGLSGYNTRWAKIVLPRLIHKDHNAGNILAVTVFFGANDSALKDENPRQHVPLEEYADNLKSMIGYLNSVDISKQDIILVTPPPLHEASWEKECMAKGEKLNRLNSATGEYAKACVKVAEECGTDVIDLWTLMQKGNQDFSCYLSDGLHLSEKGNTFLANQLWTLLEKKLSALPQLLPYWRDVDHLYPEASLLGIPTTKKQ